MAFDIGSEQCILVSSVTWLPKHHILLTLALLSELLCYNLFALVWHDCISAWYQTHANCCRCCCSARTLFKNLLALQIEKPCTSTRCHGSGRGISVPIWWWELELRQWLLRQLLWGDTRSIWKINIATAEEELIFQKELALSLTGW